MSDLTLHEPKVKLYLRGPERKGRSGEPVELTPVKKESHSSKKCFYFYNLSLLDFFWI